jgi:hypothetical protein
MTQNVYVGTDVDAVIRALVSPETTDDIPAVLGAVETCERTDYGARMAAIADRIAQMHPHAVGLQEVSRLDIDLTALGAPVVIHADFLPAILVELRNRGLHYRVAAAVRNVDANPVPGIRLVDSDVLLVDETRVDVREAGGQHFAVNLGVVAPGVDLRRGWVWARTTIAGKPVVLASTHLEGSARNMPQLMGAQASELATFLAGSDPVFLMGDFNDRPGSPMHHALLAAGFRDTWAEAHPGADGFTCCHASDLSDQVARFTERIDYVFTRGIGSGRTPHGVVFLTGDQPSDRITGGRRPSWPSDHAGVVASLF